MPCSVHHPRSKVWGRVRIRRAKGTSPASSQAGTGEAVDITVTSSEFAPVLYLYKTSCGTPANLVTCSLTGSLGIPGGLGGDYWLVVDSPAEAEWGAYDLTVTLN